MSKSKLCWTSGCIERDEENFIIYFGYEARYYTCNVHKVNLIRYCKNNGYEYKSITTHICGLILCKECLENVEEVLNY